LGATRGHSFAEIRVEPLQILCQPFPRGFGQPRSVTRGEPLQLGHNLQELLDVFLCEWGDSHARLMRRRSGNVSLTLETLKSGADGGSAHAESLRHLRFDHPRARGELPAHDHAPQ